MKLLFILKEIKSVAASNTIKLSDLKYNRDIDSKYPSGGATGWAKITNKESFEDWKRYMMHFYPDTRFKLIPNPNKKFWYQGKYLLRFV